MSGKFVASHEFRKRKFLSVLIDSTPNDIGEVQPIEDDRKSDKDGRIDFFGDIEFSLSTVLESVFKKIDTADMDIDKLRQSKMAALRAINKFYDRVMLERMTYDKLIKDRIRRECIAKAESVMEKLGQHLTECSVCLTGELVS